MPRRRSYTTRSARSSRKRRGGDLGFHLHLPQRASNGLSLDVVPVPVVRRLPVASKRLPHGSDPRQPFDGSHAVMTGDDRANGIPMILWQVAAVHLVGNKDLASASPCLVEDCARRRWDSVVWAALSAFPGRLLRARSRRRPPSGPARSSKSARERRSTRRCRRRQVPTEPHRPGVRERPGCSPRIPAWRSWSPRASAATPRS